MTVALLTLAGFLAVLAFLASQLHPAAPARPRPVAVLRRVYETTVVETIVGARSAPASVTQSVSSSGASAYSAAPTTRTS